MLIGAAAPATPRYREKREAILSAAALLFNEHGLRGATLADIAGSVGLVTNSVTYYYRKKEDLASACLLRSIAAFEAVALTAAAHADVPERVRAFFRGHAQLLAAIEDGTHAPLIVFNDIRALPEPQTAVVFAAYTAMFKRVRALLKGPQTALLERDDLNARAHIVLSIANWMGPWIGRYEPAEYARVADRVSDILIRGIAGAGAVWSPPEDDAVWHPTRDVDSPSEAFLRAATVLVNEQGYRGASIDKISARLNVTKGSFYHHNDNKLDLIAACFERSFAVMRQALVRAEASPGSGWSRACAAACALVRFQLSTEGPLLRATATSALPDHAQREQVRATLRRLTERMTSVVVDGMVDGSVRPLDPAVAAQIAVATINAAAELQRWVPGVKPSVAADLYVRAAFEGLLCPGVAQR
ncbi:MAG: TetR/AcrR family transcriptional regulator [Casimicrobiaceae bacterium]